MLAFANEHHTHTLKLRTNTLLLQQSSHFKMIMVLEVKSGDPQSQLYSSSEDNELTDSNDTLFSNC